MLPLCRCSRYIHVCMYVHIHMHAYLAKIPALSLRIASTRSSVARRFHLAARSASSLARLTSSSQAVDCGVLLKMWELEPEVMSFSFQTALGAWWTVRTHPDSQDTQLQVPRPLYYLQADCGDSQALKPQARRDVLRTRLDTSQPGDF